MTELQAADDARKTLLANKSQRNAPIELNMSSKNPDSDALPDEGNCMQLLADLSAKADKPVNRPLAETIDCTNHSQEAITKRIKSLLSGIACINCFDYDIIGDVNDLDKSFDKDESFVSIDERKKTHIKETSLSSLIEASFQAKGTFGVSVSASGGFHKERGAAEGSTNVSSMKTTCAILTKTTEFFVKKCIVNARLKDHIVKQLNAYLFNLNYNETNVEKCAEELHRILKKSCHNCKHDNQVVEGTFMFGGWYRKIATAISSKDTEFSVLREKAHAEMCTHAAVGAKRCDDTGGLSANSEQEKDDKKEEMTQDVNLSCTAISTSESAPGNTDDINDLQQKLRDPKNWTLFPTNDLEVVTFFEILSRDKELGLVADLLNYENASTIEHSRMNCLWEILKIDPAQVQHPRDMWRRIKAYSNQNDLHLETMRILVDGEINRTIQKHTKLLNIVKHCKNTQEVIGDNGVKLVAKNLYRNTSIQPFLKSFLECDDNNMNEEKRIIKEQLLQHYYIHLDTIEVNLDPVIRDFYCKKRNVAIEEKADLHENYDQYKCISLDIIPKKLLSIKREDQFYHIKAAYIFKFADSVMYGTEYHNEFIRIAKDYKYVDEESRLSFADDLVHNMPALVDQLQRVLQSKVIVDETVCYTSHVENWEGENVKPFKIKAFGTVTRVVEYKADVSVNKIECYKEFEPNPYKIYDETCDEAAFQKCWTSNKSVFKFCEILSSGNNKKLLLEGIPFFLLEKVAIPIESMTISPLDVKWRNEQNDQDQRISYQDFYVDRPYHESDSLSENVIVDRLKYRTDVFRKSEVLPIASEDLDPYGFGSDDKEDESQTTEMENGAGHTEVEPFNFLLDLIRKGNLSVQQEIFKILLDQRYSVPLVFKYSEDNILTHLKNALMFSKVKYFKNYRSIDEDIDLPRAVFLSECYDSDVTESIDLASQVFNCHFASKGSCIKRFSTMCELTVGFLKSNNLDSECPWMVLHIRGDYSPVKPYLEQFKPDVILVEVDPSRTEFSFKENLATITERLMSWGTNKNAYKYDRKDKLFTGSFNSIAADGIVPCLNTIMPMRSGSSFKESRKTLKSIDVITPQDVIIGQEFVEKTIKSFSINTLKDRLILQKSFKKQGDLHRQLQVQNKTKNERNAIHFNISNEEKLRADKAVGYVQNLEVLLLFCRILSMNDDDLRIVLVNYFEANINKECALSLKSEKCNVNQAYETYSESRKPNSLRHNDKQYLEEKYYEAKKTYIDKCVSIENIWRELIYCYDSAPLHYTPLPDLAAQYLLDGFALELMDGDTGILCKKWTEDLFHILQKKLTGIVGRTAKVFILSIMGTQSTGKSAMLNIMFGCRMPVSAGRCTKGVHMQLIKSDFNKNFDYVLILDTEGIRAPEFFDEDWAIWNDNRMATLAILSADATIITTVNEEDIAIREVVPIALLAYKKSKIAEENTGRQPTKLFFTYSRVDTTNISKFSENRESLRKTLHDAEKNMTDDGRQDYKGFLDSFNTSEDESESDIKYFGFLNKGENPPDDTPNYEFGRKIASFRKYIDERTKCRDGQTLDGWSKHVQLVYNCLETTKFELTFRSAMEHKAFNEFEEKMDEIKQIVAENFCEAFLKVEEAIMKTEAKDKNVKNLEYFNGMIDNHVQPTVMKNRKKVEEILEENKYESFRERRKQTFERFIKTLRADRIDKVKITYDGRFDYEDEKRKYQKNISSELQREIEQDYTVKDDEIKQDKLFERIFENTLEECKRQYPGVNVRHQVEDIYAPYQSIAQNHKERPWYKENQKLIGTEGVSGLFESVYESVMGKPWNNDSSEGAKLLKLEGQIDEILFYVKSFDGGVVHKIRSATNETTRRMNAENAEKWKEYMKETIIRKLGAIEKKWESEHNIPAKLKAEKEMLRHNFKNVICKKVFGKKRAIQQISDGLIHALKEGFLEYLPYKVLGAVEDMGWVIDSRILHAHVDLKYLELSRSGRVQELISKLENPKKFYEETVFEKIDEKVQEYKDSEWKKFVEKARRALDNSCTKALKMDADGYKKMKDVLEAELDPKVKKHLCEHITWGDQLNEDLNNTGEEIGINENFIEIRKGIDSRLNTICKPSWEIIDYTKKVYILLGENYNPGAQPRCTAVCPRCKLSCSKSLGHYKYTEQSRHNCDHQPDGLVGRFLEESNKLSGLSCAEAVSRGDYMIIDGKSVPYTDFDKQYPEWMLPSEASSKSRVRKYLFQEHNKAIAEHYGLKEPDRDNLDPWITSSIDELIDETWKKIK